MVAKQNKEKDDFMLKALGSPYQVLDDGGLDDVGGGPPAEDAVVEGRALVVRVRGDRRQVIVVLRGIENVVRELFFLNRWRGRHHRVFQLEPDRPRWPRRGNALLREISSEPLEYPRNAITRRRRVVNAYFVRSGVDENSLLSVVAYLHPDDRRFLTFKVKTTLILDLQRLVDGAADGLADLAVEAGVAELLRDLALSHRQRDVEHAAVEEALAFVVFNGFEGDSDLLAVEGVLRVEDDWRREEVVVVPPRRDLKYNSIDI